MAAKIKKIIKDSNGEDLTIEGTYEEVADVLRKIEQSRQGQIHEQNKPKPVLNGLTADEVRRIFAEEFAKRPQITINPAPVYPIYPTYPVQPTWPHYEPWITWSDSQVSLRSEFSLQNAAAVPDWSYGRQQ